MLVDSHCHLDYIEAGLFGHDPDRPLEEVLAKSREHGVVAWLNPSVEPKDFDRVRHVAERFEQVYFGLSIHPCDVMTQDDYPDWLERIEAGLAHPKAVAIGETGLDYFRQDANSAEARRQRHSFEQLLALAEKTGKPVIVHDRDAHEDVAAMVADFPQVRGVMHCFSGDAAFAETMMGHGFYISFAGNVTFKKAEALRDAARQVPLSRLLVETDAPFLSPEPERGRPNEPYRTRFVAERLALVKHCELDELAAATTANATSLFKLCY